VLLTRSEYVQAGRLWTNAGDVGTSAPGNSAAPGMCNTTVHIRYWRGCYRSIDLNLHDTDAHLWAFYSHLHYFLVLKA
jgi:hypothetical protein